MNGREMTVPKGWTVMQAARHAGEQIPHFCWHPGLSVAGVCRFCMVRVEGRKKLEIGCNLQITDGMAVSTTDDEVKEAHKWALEFHLVNHPLDCPICDQAGECGLQDYYMKVGKYESEMTRPKVLKPKALAVGSELVLDTERCILCSRCVRFEEEVTKTNALGIFSRGDRAIIGTYPDKKIEHNYQGNLVDICPVGAFTLKDFRFKQRVWFLQHKESICPGCSTGCSVNVYANTDFRAYYRIKPSESEVNGHWMCDVGRGYYKHLNPAARLRSGVVIENGKRKNVATAVALETLAAKLKGTAPADITLLVSAQYTNEEYEAFFNFFIKELGVKNVLQWREPTEKVEEFDGLLYRGDHNPNTQGLLAALKKFGVGTTAKNQFDEVAAAKAKVLIALAPEVPETFPSLNDQVRKLAELPFVSLWTCSNLLKAAGQNFHGVPLKGFAEKQGTYINHAGKPGNLSDPFAPAVEQARDVAQVVDGLREHLSSKRA
jgi:NADH-quinone oxidoreductase subunit G